MRGLLILVLVVLVVLMVVLVGGCGLPGHVDVEGGLTPDAEPVGFWFGVWHGLLCWLTWIIEIFNRDVRIYAAHNTGIGYDLGWLLGAGILFGNLGFTIRFRGVRAWDG